MAIEPTAGSRLGAPQLQPGLAPGQTQSQAALRATLAALNLREGDRVKALVTGVQALDKQLRTRLLDLLQPGNATTGSGGANSRTAAPAAVTVNPAVLQRLLQQPGLQLVQLQVRDQPLVAFSDRPLRPGNPVQLSIEGGALRLSPAPASGTAGAAGPGPAGLPGAAAPLANTAGATQTLPLAARAQVAHPATDGLALARPTRGADTPQASASGSGQVQTTAVRPDSLAFDPLKSDQLKPDQLRALQQALRALLPRQPESGRPLLDTLQAAHDLKQLLTTPAGVRLRHELPRDLQQSLQSLARQLPTPAELVQPGRLREVVERAGLQLERQLLRQAVDLAAEGRSAERIHSALGQALTRELPQQDLKAALLQLNHLLGLALPSPAQPPASGQTAAADTALLALLRQLASGAPSASRPARQLAREPLLRQLQQQSGLALERVALQQLQSLQRGVAAPEANSGQHWQLEIPLRWGDEVQLVRLRIEGDWTPPGQESRRDGSRRVRQWQVKLAFELPGAGTLHAHLTVLENSVSASLWAEEPATLARARIQLAQLQDRLQREGVEITRLECFPGRPREDTIGLNSGLVDITT